MKPVKQRNINLIEAGKEYRFQPGVSGNPNGRPSKDLCLTTLIKELLGEKATWIAPGSTGDDKTWRQMIVKALLTKAAQGEMKAIELVLDRIDGKVTIPVDAEAEVRMLHEWVTKDAEA